MAELELYIKKDSFEEFRDKYKITTVKNYNGRGVIVVLKNTKPKEECNHIFEDPKLLAKLTCKHCGIKKIKVQHNPV